MTIINKDIDSNTLDIYVDEHEAIIAEMLYIKHHDNLIFDTSKAEWAVFTDGIWLKAEEAAKVLYEYYCQMILDISRSQYPEINIGNAKWLKSTMNHGKFRSTLKILELKTAKGVDKLNGAHSLIGIEGNVYDIEAKQARSAEAKDLVFKSLGTSYDSTAECPEWRKFLGSAMQGNKEMIDYLQRLVGYFLTASTKEQEVYYFYGSGANGKSTFLDTVTALLGNYSVKLSSKTFIKNNGGTNSVAAMANLAMLAGARLALTDETDHSNVSFDTQILKSVSGDAKVTGRFLRRNPITFDSTAKVVMYGNDKPYGNINDEGFWRRFRFIHFSHVVPKENRDADLLNKLKQELPGILNWALEGLKAWQESGLNTPETLLKDSEDYRVELDTIKEFLDASIEAEAGAVIPTSHLFDQYKIWTKENLKDTESKQAFSKRIKHYFSKFNGVKPYRNSTTRGFKGIRFIRQ